MTARTLGLPRPRNADGIPVPWNVADPHTLGALGNDGAANWLARRDRRCQVCGLSVGETGLFVTEHPTNRIVVDRRPLHPVCLRLALRWCPHLFHGNVWIYEGPVAKLEKKHGELVVPMSFPEVTGRFRP